MKDITIKPVEHETYNRRTIRYALYPFTLPSIDISDPKQVEQRISEYFAFCIEHNEFPSIAGLSNWLGIHRDTLHSWKTGEMRKNTHQQIIQRAYAAIEEIIVTMMLEKKLTPGCGIFFLKAMFGYKDKFDIGLETAAAVKRNPYDTITDTELAKKYLLESIPDEQS